MPTNTRVNIDGFRSWFNDTKYVLLDRIEDRLTDKIYDLFGEIDDGSKSDTISVTGRDDSGFAKAKAPGAKIDRQAPVEEDQLSKGFVSFGKNRVIEYESVVHDQYQFATDGPEDLVDNVLDSASLLLHHQLFNFSTATSVTLPSSGGTVSYGLTVPNGQALFSNSHSGPGYSSKDNIQGTGALSNANLIANIQHGNQNMVTSNGTSIAYQPDALIIGNDASMLEKALQLTRTEKVESTANNAVNIFSGGTMDVVRLKFAPRDASGFYDTSKQYYWITADKAMMKKALCYKWASRPQAMTKFMDPENGDSYISVIARLAVVAKRWQGMVLNNSTTQPTTSS